MSKVIDLTNISREEWLKLRLNGIGASESAALLGCDPYKTAVDLYLNKTTGKSIEDNHTMRYGRDIEPIIAKWFSEDTGFEVIEDNTMRFDTVEPLFFANLDRLINFEGKQYPLELKSTTENLWKIRQEEANADEENPVPFLSHFIQVQHQLAVFGADWAYIAYEISGYYGKKLVYIKIDRNEAVIHKIRETVKNFWENNVLKLTPPKAESREDLEKYLIPEAGKKVEATENILRMIQDLKLLHEEKKMFEDRIKQIQTELAFFMDNAEILTHNGTALVTYKTVERKGYEVKPTSFRMMKTNYSKINAELAA